MESSQQPPRLTARQKLLIQLLAFIGLALLLYLKPQVEAWVESRLPNPQTANDKTDKSVENSSTPASPWKKYGGSKATSEEASERSETVDAAEDFDDSLMTDAASSAEPSENSSATASKTATPEKASVPASPKKTQSSGKKSSITKMDRTEPTQRRVPDHAERSNPPPAEKDATKSALGKLKEIDDNVFESTAGLVYLPGSADGHRLRHVMEHAKDNTGKEIHGIFDGDREEVLAVIDEAFLKAQKGGPDVRSEKQNGRRVYTVNLKRRIGQVGGRQGERQGNPDCQYLRLVLENDVEVITAYPSKSF